MLPLIAKSTARWRPGRSWVITQVFGVCFNLGILAVLLANLSFKDVEFGWQSSLMHSNEAAYRIASDIATPWKWFAPHPHPTLQEVEESHFQFGVKQSNKSWWPFLRYAILCYGLLPRLLLLIFAVAKWEEVYWATRVRSWCVPLVLPAIDWPHDSLDGRQRGAGDSDTRASAPHHVPSGTTFAILASDLEIPEGEIAEHLRQTFGWQLAACESAQVDYPSGNGRLLELLSHKAASLTSVVVLVPADRAPIKAIALTLHSIRQAAAVLRNWVLLIVGRKTVESFSPVAAEELKHWQNFTAIHRLPISLETWPNR